MPTEPRKVDHRANARQIGGTHYKTDFEPWDFCLLYSLPALEFTAMVYVARARKKNGAQDYTKAMHYVDKMIEAKAAQMITPPFVVRGVAAVIGHLHGRPSVGEIDFLAFAKANDLTLEEDVVIRGICDWKTVADLELARSVLMGMIERLTP